MGGREATAGQLALLLELALLTGDRTAADAISPQLEGLTAVPYNDVELIDVARLLGEVAALRGEREQARSLYQRALDWATSIRYRPEVALTRLELAELLLDEAVSYQQSAVGKRAPEEQPTADRLMAEGLEHLNFAIEEFRAMRMQPSLERALRHKELLTA